MRRKSRAAVIRQRLRADRLVRVHSLYLRRMGWPTGKGLVALLRWFHRRTRRQRWARLRLWRRFAVTVIEMHRRNARLQRIYKRRAFNRPPARVRWVIEASRKGDRIDEVFPPVRPAKVVFSRRARIRAWLASTRLGDSQ